MTSVMDLIEQEKIEQVIHDIGWVTMLRVSAVQGELGRYRVMAENSLPKGGEE